MCVVDFSENAADNFNRSLLVLNFSEINFMLRQEVMNTKHQQGVMASLDLSFLRKQSLKRVGYGGGRSITIIYLLITLNLLQNRIRFRELHLVPTTK